MTTITNKIKPTYGFKMCYLQFRCKRIFKYEKGVADFKGFPDFK